MRLELREPTQCVLSLASVLLACSLQFKAIAAVVVYFTVQLIVLAAVCTCDRAVHKPQVRLHPTKVMGSEQTVAPDPFLRKGVARETSNTLRGVGLKRGMGN